MDSHHYSHETSIFTLGEGQVKGRQTQLHASFTPGKIVQPQVSQFFEIPTLFCPNGLNDVLQNFLIARAVDIVYFHFLHFFTKKCYSKEIAILILQ